MAKKIRIVRVGFDPPVVYSLKWSVFCGSTVSQGSWNRHFVNFCVPLCHRYPHQILNGLIKSYGPRRWQVGHCSLTWPQLSVHPLESPLDPVVAKVQVNPLGGREADDDVELGLDGLEELIVFEDVIAADELDVLRKPVRALPLALPFSEWTRWAFDSTHQLGYLSPNT